MNTRQEILLKRVNNFLRCKEFVKLAILEREKFESIKTSFSPYEKAYNPHSAPELIQDAAMVGYRLWSKGIVPTIFNNVESVEIDSAYDILRLYPVNSCEPMVEWANQYSNEFYK